MRNPRPDRATGQGTREDDGGGANQEAHQGTNPRGAAAQRGPEAGSHKGTDTARNAVDVHDARGHATPVSPGGNASSQTVRTTGQRLPSGWVGRQ